MGETYTPNQGAWIELPPPTSKKWDFGDRVGSLVHRINPAFLSYWNPDVSTRGFLFVFLGFAAASWFLHFAWTLVPLLWQMEPPAGMPYLMGKALPVILSLMGPGFAAAVYLSARKPLPPPTYFNRQHQRVIHYWKAPGHKGLWLDWDWSEVTAAVRQVHVVSQAGRSTQYLLMLMKLEPGTNKILRGFAAYSSVGQSQPCVAAWEFMRRYMNEPPERVPAAYVPPFGFDKKTWAVRCQMETMQLGIQPDGSCKNGFDRFFLPLFGTFLYLPIWATLWIEKTAPKLAPPPEIAALNTWDESQANPYKIEHAWGKNSDDPPLDQVYARVRTRHQVMTVLGFGFYLGMLALMLGYGWAASLGN